MADEILNVLANDENPYVRCRAIKTLERLSPSGQFEVQFAQETPGEGFSFS